MVRYFGLLILSFLSSILMIGYFWVIYREKKENGKNYKLPIVKLFGVLIGMLGMIFIFVINIPDLPNILSHHPSKYEGKCEIYIKSGKGAHLEANFKEHSIWFDSYEYTKARAGHYYCKVEYYPHSDVGNSLIIYQNKGGKQVKIKE